MAAPIAKSLAETKEHQPLLDYMALVRLSKLLTLLGDTLMRMRATTDRSIIDTCSQNGGTSRLMKMLLPLLVFALNVLPLAPAMAQGAVTVSKRVEADGTHTLVHEVTIEAAASDVWAAIATADGWKTWAVPVAWGSESDIIETSYDASATPGAAGTIRQQVMFRLPNRILAFRTVKAPASFPNWPSYKKVSSVFELEPLEEKKTRVRLTSVGYPGTPAGQQLVSFFESGNATSLEWLRARFIDGPANWKKRLAPKR